MTPEDRARRAFVPVREAIDAGRVPGAVLGIIAADGTRAVLHAGLAQKVPEPVPMRRNTVFDLASLTKVVFTATRVMEFMAEHRIAPHQPLADAIPDLRQYAVDTAMERRITVLQCLTHRTSLPAVEPLYTLGLDPATLRAYVLQREWPSVPPVYSDINFILLGILIERLSGQPLNRQPLDHGFTFRPVTADCASTEHCTWRGARRKCLRIGRCGGTRRPFRQCRCPSRFRARPALRHAAAGSLPHARVRAAGRRPQLRLAGRA
jgi:CubicO group peptidase (beta-lactamase class C family)